MLKDEQKRGGFFSAVCVVSLLEVEQRGKRVSE